MFYFFSHNTDDIRQVNMVTGMAIVISDIWSSWKQILDNSFITYSGPSRILWPSNNKWYILVMWGWWICKWPPGSSYSDHICVGVGTSGAVGHTLLQIGFHFLMLNGNNYNRPNFETDKWSIIAMHGGTLSLEGLVGVSNQIELWAIDQSFWSPHPMLSKLCIW